MIFFVSDGRLGNQLFQYAFLNSTAKKNEWIIAANMQQFIDHFNIKRKRFLHIPYNKLNRFLIRKLFKPYFFQWLVTLRIIGYIRQNRTNSSALPSYTKKNGLLPITLVETHFFQAEDFFIPSAIDFSLKPQFIKSAQFFLQVIPEQYTPVFVHIRRTDYLKETYLGKVGIDLPFNYFEKALAIIEQRIERPFYVFLSDDFEFIEKQFSHIENKIFSNNSMGIDLAIMSLCANGITSNSSFSWWGAYLMKDKNVVVFPQYWYGWKSKIESHPRIQPDWGVLIDPNQSDD